MASKNVKGIQEFVTSKLEDAKTRLSTLEKEAEGALKELVAKGKAQGKELEGLVEKLSGEIKTLDKEKALKAVGKKANEVSAEARRRLEKFQTGLIEAVGVASESQVRELTREISKLSKKLDTLVGKKAA